MTLDYISEKNHILTLTNNKYFDLINIDGQTSANTNISSLSIGNIDGDTVNNVNAQPRSIVMDLRIKSGANVEEAKRAVLSVVKLKQHGTLKWTQNNRITVIEGIVESIEMPRWNNSVTMQITLHCEQPFWEDIENAIQEINEALDLHYFTDESNDMLYFPEEGIVLGEYDMSRTRDFYNLGDVAVGLDIEIIAFEQVTNPIIYDSSGAFFGVGYGEGNKCVTMQSGDIINISTHKGKKSVKLNGENIISKVKPRSTWLQLEAGENTFTISAEEESIENMTFTLMYKQRYV